MCYEKWLTLVCLLVFFGLAVGTSLAKNPTTDEPVHMTRAVNVWQGGDWRFQLEHTPLSHWVIGLMAQTEPVPAVDQLPGWSADDRLAAAQALVWERGLDVGRLFFLGRMGIVWLGMILGAVCVRWGRDLGGARGMVITAVLYAFSSNLIAHAALATTDFAATAGFVTAAYALARYARGRAHWFTAGLGLGVGIAAKMTGAILAPVALLVLLIIPAEKKTGWRGAVRRWGRLLPPAGLVVWATYRFEVGRVTELPWGSGLLLPAPAYWRSLWSVLTHVDEGHRAFLLGEVSADGWWHYFLVAWGVKTSLVVLVGMAAAVWGTARTGNWRQTAGLWLPAGVLFGVAAATRLNIGYRHILPVLPLVMVWGGGTVGGWAAVRRPGWARTAVGGLLVVHAVTGVWLHPHHLAAFNWAVGGPAAGYHILGDSNLDWGQDWVTAADYAVEQGIERPFISPFGFVDRSYYGLHGRSVLTEDGFAAAWFSPANPPPGTYFLSVNTVQGILAQPDLLDWFRRRDPDAQRPLGYSIHLHEVAAQAAGDWVAHCTAPGPLLEPAEAEQLVGRTGLRHVYFDCEQGWVFPAGGAGWYILPSGDGWWGEAVAGTAVEEVYAHGATVFAPSYTVMYTAGSMPNGGEGRPGWADAGGAPADLVAIQKNENEWRTAWRVGAATERPLSVLGHLYATAESAGPPTAVADGLAFGAEQWRPGDRFVQRHRFEAGGEALETGLYDFVGGERLGSVRVTE